MCIPLKTPKNLGCNQRKAGPACDCHLAEYNQLNCTLPGGRQCEGAWRGVDRGGSGQLGLQKMKTQGISTWLCPAKPCAEEKPCPLWLLKYTRPWDSSADLSSAPVCPLLSICVHLLLATGCSDSRTGCPGWWT